jgi:hypothetical protein
MQDSPIKSKVADIKVQFEARKHQCAMNSTSENNKMKTLTLHDCCFGFGNLFFFLVASAHGDYIEITTTFTLILFKDNIYCNAIH